MLGRGALVLAVFFIGIFVSVIYYQISEKKLTESPKKFLAQIYNLNKQKDVLFPAVEIKAKAGVVYDLTTEKILYSKNSQQALPLASITKLMTALIVKKTLNQTDLVTFIDENNKQEAWRPKELSDYTLVGSSNIGARALAMASANKINRNFVELMNQEKEKLGLSTLRFQNETGLDQTGTMAGGYGSALDVAKLHGYIVKNYPELTEATNQTAIGRNDTQENRYVAINTNYAIDQLPGLISSKTGTTPLAGANLSIIFDVGLNHPVAIVILGSTEEERFNDTQKLAGATVAYFAEGGK
jgi:D-alanyl-D-alanine carboxypeptidase